MKELLRWLGLATMVIIGLFAWRQPEQLAAACAAATFSWMAMLGTVLVATE